LFKEVLECERLPRASGQDTVTFLNNSETFTQAAGNKRFLGLNESFKPSQEPGWIPGFPGFSVKTWKYLRDPF